MCIHSEWTGGVCVCVLVCVCLRVCACVCVCVCACVTYSYYYIQLQQRITHRARSLFKEKCQEVSALQAKFKQLVKVWNVIIIFEGIMNARLYVQILESALLPFIETVYPDGHRFIVEPPNKGHFGDNINSADVSFVERLFSLRRFKIY